MPVPLPLAARHGRDLDLVLVGATGFTGGLTARYLSENAPVDLRWAVAGRDPARLDRLIEALADNACPPQEYVVIDVGRHESIDPLVARTAMVVTTTGPYLEHGEPLVRACASAGTHYLDLTGEAEFVDHMYDLHHDRAVGTGAKLVHACGFDSIPHDLGAQFTVEQFGFDQSPPGAPVTMRGVVRTTGSLSGGTLHSALGALSRLSEARQAADRRRRREKRPAHRSARVVSTRITKDDVLDLWLAPLPTIDPAIVVRSARALEAYGPDFRYSHHAGMARLSSVAKGAAAVAGIATAAQIPVLRDTLGARVPRGSGPSDWRRTKSTFSVDFIASSQGTQVHTRVSGGDPGYTETAKMLAESALCLLFDAVPEVAGQVTTAVAMGALLRERLQRAGMTFEVIGA